MNLGKLIKIIALVELVAALPWHGVYLFGWYARRTTEFDPWMVFFTIEGICFMLFPLLSVVGVFLNKKWAYYTLMVFPVLAFIHGISAIPYLSHIAPIGHWRTLVLAVINGGLIFYINKLRKGAMPQHA